MFNALIDDEGVQRPRAHSQTVYRIQSQKLERPARAQSQIFDNPQPRCPPKARGTPGDRAAAVTHVARRQPQRPRPSSPASPRKIVRPLNPAPPKKESPREGVRQRKAASQDSVDVAQQYKSIRYNPEYDKKWSNKPREWIYGTWALFISMYACVFGVILGGAGLLYSFRDAALIPETYVELYHCERWKYTHMASIGGSVVVFLLSLLPPFQKSGVAIWQLSRAIVLLVLGLGLAQSLFTALPGVMFILAAIFFVLSTVKKEAGSVNLWDNSPPAKLFHALKRCCFSCNPEKWLLWHVARGSIARMCVRFVWLGICAVLFYTHYMSALGKVDAMATMESAKCAMWFEERPASECAVLADNVRFYFPIAKGCGFCLDFNCALIVIFVTQMLVKRMYKARGISFLSWIPVEHSLEFHKHIGSAIFVFACGHIFGHYMAQDYMMVGLVSRTLPFNGAVNFVDGQWPMFSVWISGGLLTTILVFICASSSVSARKKRYDTFRYVHIISAIMFYLILFWHAEVFFYYGGLPFVLYLIDLGIRNNSSSVKLLEARYTEPVLQLKFSVPFQYSSGMWCRLRCPLLETSQANEWHPFTISSAYESNTLSFHIKCHPGGWTERLRECVHRTAQHAKKMGWGKTIDDKSDFNYTFGNYDPITNHYCHGLPNWSDAPLFMVNGPHAAPAMHFSNYETVLVIGAGIGLTPLNSIVQHMTSYNWRLPNKAGPTAVYGVFLGRQEEMPAYRWFMDSLSDYEVSLGVAQSTRKECCAYEMHVFVTSVEGNFKQKMINSGKTVELQHGSGNINVKRPFTGEALMKLSRYPSVPSAEFTSRMKNRSGCTMGNTSVWNGRPDWQQIFDRISRHHARDKHRVGVFFCGAPMIVKDVKQAAEDFTNPGIIFQVNEEFF